GGLLGTVRRALEGRRPGAPAERARSARAPGAPGAGARHLTVRTPLSDRDLFARLVAFDTTSHLSNLPMVDFLADYLDRPGVRITRLPSAAGDKANLLITRGPERHDGRGLMLSGHMDVVPAGEANWNSDPFTLTEAGDTLVARGAADMKGFLALASNCLASLDPRTLH